MTATRIEAEATTPSHGFQSKPNTEGSGGEAARAPMRSGTPDEPLRILTLGDTITAGVVESRTGLVTGGYRPPLAERLEQNGIVYDFVGELTQSLPNLADGDHGGYSGRTIDFLDKFDQTLVERYDPHVVLLMAGTNDIKLDDAATMLADMRSLLQSLTTASPDMHVLVATIPPIDPANAPANRVARVDEFNAGLEILVSELVGDGLSVGFVDMRDLTLDEISDIDVDLGLHPTEAGYQMIADHWADALEDHLGTAPEPRVEVVTRPNGDVFTTTYRADDTIASLLIEDGSERRPWEQRLTDYDETGQVTRIVQVQDFGQIVTTQFDENGERRSRITEDAVDRQAWSTITSEYGEDGAIERSTIVYDHTDIVSLTYHDNGERASRTYEDIVDRRDWTSFTDTYTEDGALIERSFVWDDGTGLI